MPHIADSTLIEGLLDHQAYRTAPTFNTLANSTLSLTLTSNHVQFFDGATAGQIVKMPVATTLQNGHRFVLYNNSTTAVMTIQDAAAVQLVLAPFTSSTRLILFDNTTTAGVWVVETTAVGTANSIIHYTVSGSATFTTTAVAYSAATVITGQTVTPIAGTYSVWYNGLATMASGNKTHHFALFKGGTIIADSERFVDSASASAGMIDSTITVTQVDGTQTVDVRIYTDTGTSLSITNRSLVLIRIGS